MEQAPPGWYADPGSPRHLRWWDGRQWTAHVQPTPGTGPHAGAPAPSPAGPTAPDGQPLAGWWMRVLALVLDTVIVTVPNLLVSLPAQLEVQREQRALQRDLERRLASGDTVDLGGFFGGLMDSYAEHVVGLFLLPMLVTLTYFAGFLLWKGATPGKLVCGLRVRPREQDGRLAPGTVAVRLAVQLALPNTVYVLAFLSGSFGVAVLVALLVCAYALTDALVATGQRGQTLHDRAAGTVVVRTRG